jgi:hypothetical protein
VWVCGRLLAGIVDTNSRRGHACSFLMIVVFCQVEVSATGQSLVQGSPIACGVSECDPGTSKNVRPKFTRAIEPWKPTKTEAIYAISI